MTTLAETTLVYEPLKLLLEPKLAFKPQERYWTETELTSSVASHNLNLLYNVFARHFHTPEQRKNIMQEPVRALSALFGDEIVSEEIRLALR